jgi:ribosomal protein S18 acetylase RimI-like enzyme
VNFPTQFDQSTKNLVAENLDNQSQQDINTMAEKGYEVHSGLTQEYAEAVAKMCLEPGIKEYCPNDSGRRFSSPEVTASWLSKGRAVFFLFMRDESQSLTLVGYGWSGASQSTHVPDGKTTFAIRIAEAGQGQGLATPFARLIVNATKSLYSSDNFWLETWQSNEAAVHVYHKIGFTDVVSVPGPRLSADGSQVSDTRIYMKLKD